MQTQNYLLLFIITILLSSCEKEQPIEYTHTQDYREKWIGTYGIVDKWTYRYVVSITEGTDSMIHIEGGAGWTIKRDIQLHSNGTFSYRNGSGIYDTTSGFFTLTDNLYGTDSLYIEYLVPGHFSPAKVEDHCFRMPKDLLE